MLVDPTDPTAIAEGLIKAITEWDHFAPTGRQRVHDQYTWDRTAAGYITAIESALTPFDGAAIHPYFDGGPDVTSQELVELIG